MGKKSQQRRAMWPLCEGREIWGVDGAFASMTWRRHCIRDGVAPSANELAWFYMGSRLGHAEAFPKRKATQRRVTYERELFFWSSTPSKTWIAQSCARAKEVVVILFVMYTETTMKYALCCCSMLCFAWFFLVPAVTLQVATHCLLLVRKRHCFTETVGLLVAAVLYATGPRGIVCAVPFLGGRGFSWWACSSVPSRYLLSWVENDFINCLI